MEDAEHLFADESNVDAEVADDATMREDILKRSADGELKRTPARIKKAHKKVLKKWRAKVHKKQAQKANKFLADFLLNQFAGPRWFGCERERREASSREELQEGKL